MNTISDLSVPLIVLAARAREAVSEIIKATTRIGIVEETVYTGIRELASNLIQQAQNGSANLEEYAVQTQPLHGITGTIAELRQLAQSKLQYLDDLLHTIETLNPSNERDIEDSIL